MKQSQRIWGRMYRLWIEADVSLRRRLVSTYAVLIGLNIAVWATLLLSSARYGLLLGLAPVAYGFGLRHAVDPDHIAAIDNTTRKLMREGQRPVGVGFFFSLGHSTVVFALSLLIALSAGFVKSHLPEMRSVGAVLGITVSGAFLLMIAVINFAVLIDVYKTWRAVARGNTYSEAGLEDFLRNRGLLNRLFRPMVRLVSHSWQMYLVGLLFGLGFDTASEVGILGMSATAGAGGMPVWLILLLPLLFVAGMALVDTTDGVAMLGAYGWAQVRPVRKLYYNMNITLISVVIAAFIGGVEVLQVVGIETGMSDGILGWAQSIQLASVGYYVIGIFMVGWIASLLIYKFRHIDRLDDALMPTPTSLFRSGD